MSTVNTPHVAKTTVFVYTVLVVFLAAMSIGFLWSGLFTSIGTTALVFFVVAACIEAVMVLILRSLYRSRYILSNDQLVIKTTKLIGGTKTIPLNTVDSVETVSLPCGLRLFGASFHGGYYDVQNIGRTFQAITNFKDGLLIRAKNKNYVITPRDKLNFKAAIDNKRNV